MKIHTLKNVNYLLLVLIFAVFTSHVFAAQGTSPETASDAKKLSLQAEKLYEQGKYHEAISHEERALTIRENTLGVEHPDTAESLDRLGMFYGKLGGFDDYDKVQALLKKSLAIREKVLGAEHPDTAKSLNSLATIAVEYNGDLKSAESLYKRAQSICEKSLGLEHPGTATIINNLGSLYIKLGDYSKAEALLKKSLAIKEKALGAENPATAPMLNNLSDLYVKLGDYESAEIFMKKAAAIEEKAYGSDNPNLIRIYNNLAFIYQLLGDYAKAEHLFKKSRELSIKVFGHSHKYSVSSNTNLAYVYLVTGRYDEAYKIFNYEADTAGLGSYYLAIKKYPQAERKWLPDLKRAEEKSEKASIIRAHTGLGLAYEGMKDYPKAKAQFRSAIDTIESQWKTLSADAKRNFLTGGVTFTRLDPYEALIRILIQEGGEETAKESLSVAESVKGRLFLEMLATREIRGTAAADDKILKQERTLQGELLALRRGVEMMEQSKLKPPEEKIRQLKDEFDKKASEYERFINEVKLGHGELATLVSVSPLNVNKLQSLLDPDVTLLEYYTAKEAIFVWLITKDDVKSYAIQLKEQEIKEQADALITFNLSRDARKRSTGMLFIPDSQKRGLTVKEKPISEGSFSHSQEVLYQYLITPLEKDIYTSKLILVPHGVLHKISWATLSDGKSTLLEKFTLSVLPSASIAEFVVKKRKPGKESALILANPTTDYSSLSFAESEGQTISKIYPNSKLYNKEKATETVLKNKSSDFSIIHIAAHGEFNERQPLQSGLLLAKDKENDGYFQVHKIFGLNLKNANIVTLSACETALAKAQGGDDLVGLSRGFIYAGTPSLIATLWQVDDRSTSIVMENFYSNWKKGMSKPEALKQAQLSLKNIPEYSHPYFWAPFIMIGDWK